MHQQIKDRLWRLRNSILQSSQDRGSYTESHKADDYGEKYDNLLYAPYTYENAVWQLEKSILTDLIQDRRNERTLDFACGTGRVLEFLESLSFNHLVGIDVSESMIAKARAKLRNSELIVQDITKSNISIEPFRTVLAFRFFLNAEPQLRDDALEKIKSLLDKDGLFIFNIHSNKHSVRYLKVAINNSIRWILKVFTGRVLISSQNQLSPSTVNQLLKKHGIKVIKVISYSFLPFFHGIMPQRLWLSLEKKMASNFLIGTHLMFVCKHIGQ